jgi:hypothetical protein
VIGDGKPKVKTEEPAWVYVGNGTLRLWDGTKWTDSYRSANTPRTTVVAPRAVKAPPEPGEGSDEPRRTSRLVTWALVAAAFVVAAVAVVTYVQGS